jgi:hypothetical protein
VQPNFLHVDPSGSGARNGETGRNFSAAMRRVKFLRDRTRRRRRAIEIPIWRGIQRGRLRTRTGLVSFVTISQRAIHAFAEWLRLQEAVCPSCVSKM